MTFFGDKHQKEALIPFVEFVYALSPRRNEAFKVLFAHCDLFDDEFLVGAHGKPKCGSFVLTNHRLLQRDHRARKYVEVKFRDVERFEMKANCNFTVTERFYMKSGGLIEIYGSGSIPDGELLKECIRRSSVDKVDA